jgi:DHA1 family inner membrane transport protein
MPKPQGVRLRDEVAAFKNAQVLLAMAMTVLGFGGVFAAITYIAPMMTEVGGFADTSVTWLLVLFGVGMVGGNLLGGKYADKHLMPLLYTTLAALAVVLGLFTVTAHHKVLAAISILLIGALGFATVPPLQKRVLDQAHGAPTLASAVNIGAFNLGNALSAWLGGIVIAAGMGLTAPNWVGAVLAAAALVLAVLSAFLERRESRGGSRVLAGSTAPDPATAAVGTPPAAVTTAEPAPVTAARR